jgi:drug/metabolite transporter (DMT)-like permease
MYSGKVKKKLIAIFTFIGILTVSVLLSEVLYSVVFSHMNMRPDGDSAFSSLLRLTLSNIIMIPITVLVSVMLKGSEKNGSTIRMWLTLLLVCVYLIILLAFIFGIGKKNGQPK